MPEFRLRRKKQNKRRTTVNDPVETAKQIEEAKKLVKPVLQPPLEEEEGNEDVGVALDEGVALDVGPKEGEGGNVEQRNSFIREREMFFELLKTKYPDQANSLEVGVAVGVAKSEETKEVGGVVDDGDSPMDNIVVVRQLYEFTYSVCMCVCFLPCLQPLTVCMCVCFLPCLQPLTVCMCVCFLPCLQPLTVCMCVCFLPCLQPLTVCVCVCVSSLVSTLSTYSVCVCVCVHVCHIMYFPIASLFPNRWMWTLLQVPPLMTSFKSVMKQVMETAVPKWTLPSASHNLPHTPPVVWEVSQGYHGQRVPMGGVISPPVIWEVSLCECGLIGYGDWAHDQVL